MATIEDFSKLDIRVVEVLEVTPIEKSEKLLKLRVDTGEGERQILAGISKHYTPEELVGKKIIAIVNLEPRMMMGEESQGMILAAGDETTLSILMPERDVAVGSKIR